MGLVTTDLNELNNRLGAGWEQDDASSFILLVLDCDEVVQWKKPIEWPTGKFCFVGWPATDFDCFGCSRASCTGFNKSVALQLPLGGLRQVCLDMAQSLNAVAGTAADCDMLRMLFERRKVVMSLCGKKWSLEGQPVWPLGTEQTAALRKAALRRLQEGPRRRAGPSP